MVGRPKLRNSVFKISKYIHNQLVQSILKRDHNVIDQM